MKRIRHTNAHQKRREGNLPPKAKNFFLYVSSALLPIIFMILIYMKIGVYPFGEISPYFEDMYFQFIDLYQWFQMVLSGDSGFVYSFSKSIGGNMLPTYLYYLASPFNLLLGLFGSNRIAEFVVFTLLAHTGIAGFSMSYYASKRLNLQPLLCMVFGLCYALSQYMVTQSLNALWMDAVSLFPLAALGVYRSVQLKKPALLYIVLSISIASSWYAGYMCVVGLLLVFACEMVVLIKQDSCDEYATKEWRSSALCFLAALFLSGLTCAIILLPAIFGILSGKAAVEGVSSSSSVPFQVASFGDLFGPALFTFNYQKRWTGPQLFVGTLIIPLILFFFTCRRVPFWQKATALVLLVILFCSSSFSSLDAAWTGFAHGANYYCRWAFTFEFFLIVMAALAVKHFKKPTASDIGLFGLAVAVYLLLAVFVYLRGGFQPDVFLSGQDNLTKRYAVLFGLLLISLSVCFVLSTTSRSSVQRTALQSILLVLVCADLGFNAYTVVRNDAQAVLNTGSISTVATYIDNEADSLETLRAYDDSIYRTEKTYNKYDTGAVISSNEGLAEGYMPISQYLSTNDKAPTLFFQRMGYSSRSDIITYGVEFHTSYIAPIVPSDSLLGLKYVAAFSCPEGFRSTGLVANKSVNSTGEEAPTYWYENEEALPLGFGVASSAADTIDRGASSFDYQNSLFEKLSGNAQNMYEPLDVTLESQGNGTTTWRIEGYDTDNIVYGEIESTEDYFSYRTILQNETTTTPYFTRFSNGIFTIDKTESGTTYLTIDSDSADLDLRAVKVNSTVMDADFDSFRSKSVTLNSFTDGHVEASYDATEDGLVLFSIPVDAGWNVKVNGQTASTQAAAETLMVVPVTAGHNEITMDFTPRGLVPGACVSIAAILCFVSWCLLGSRFRRKYKQADKSR